MTLPRLAALGQKGHLSNDTISGKHGILSLVGRRRCLGHIRNPNPRRYLFIAWDWSFRNRAYHPCRIKLRLAPAVYYFYLYFSCPRI